MESINKIKAFLPKSCSQNEQSNQSILDTSLNMLLYEIMQGLCQRYKTLVDKTINSNLDAIKAKEDL